MRPLYFLLFLFFTMPMMVPAQETGDTEKEEDKPQRPAFESNFLIDNPTDKLYFKNSLEVVINHRMGLIDGGTNDLLGIYGQANIRIGLSYTLHERLQIGFGTEKEEKYQDFNWKVGLLKQTRSNRIPVNVSYYGNFVIDASKKDNFDVDQHRYSYFNQLIISRRFSPNFSMQLAPSMSHFNAVPANMNNDLFSIALGARMKVSAQTAISLDYSQPFTSFGVDGNGNDLNPEPGLSVGVEFVTSSHAFQIYFSNLKGIVPQHNYFYNQNNFFDGDILVGFTITRLYNF